MPRKPRRRSRRSLASASQMMLQRFCIISNCVQTKLILQRFCTVSTFCANYIVAAKVFGQKYLQAFLHLIRDCGNGATLVVFPGPGDSILGLAKAISDFSGVFRVKTPSYCPYFHFPAILHVSTKTMDFTLELHVVLV